MVDLTDPGPHRSTTRWGPGWRTRSWAWWSVRTPHTHGCGSERRRWPKTAGSSSGCNVENASTGIGICAEVNLAGSSWRSGGGRLVALAVVAGDGSSRSSPADVAASSSTSSAATELLVATDRGCRDPRRTASPRLRSGRRRRPERTDPAPEDTCRRSRSSTSSRTKRDGGELSDEQIRWFIENFTDSARSPTSRPRPC